MPDMQSLLNRTEEWPRVSRARFFKIDDRPGEITITKSGYGFWVCMAFGAAFMVVPVLLQNIGFYVGWLFAPFFFWAAIQNLGHGHKVRFTPERLFFYGPLSNPIGTLDRVAMQQIMVKEVQTKKGPSGRFYHQFIADTGWMSAFYCKGETLAAIQNNVLMAAFAQPLELDEDLAAFEMVVPAEQVDALHAFPRQGEPFFTRNRAERDA